MKTYILRDPKTVERQKPPPAPQPKPGRADPAVTAAVETILGLNKAQNYFGDLYRRWKARLGTPKAITAMAHKLARLLWHLFKYREAFNPEVFQKEEEKMQRKRLARLQNTAAALGLKLIPAQ